MIDRWMLNDLLRYLCFDELDNVIKICCPKHLAHKIFSFIFFLFICSLSLSFFLPFFSLYLLPLFCSKDFFPYPSFWFHALDFFFFFLYCLLFSSYLLLLFLHFILSFHNISSFFSSSIFLLIHCPPSPAPSLSPQPFSFFFFSSLFFSIFVSLPYFLVSLFSHTFF